MAKKEQVEVKQDESSVKEIVPIVEKHLEKAREEGLIAGPRSAIGSGMRSYILK